MLRVYELVVEVVEMETVRFLSDPGVVEDSDSEHFLRISRSEACADDEV